jgi:hypothetical protein
MESLIEEKPKHIFDKKYKTVISVKSRPDYLEMLDWVNLNSHGAVDVWFNAPVLLGNVIIDVAFEDPDDALIFKIKYSI